MKKWMTLLAAAALALLAGCGGPTPAETAESYLGAVKKADLEKARDLSTGENTSIEQKADDLTTEEREMFAGIFEELEYDVTKEKITGDTATVEADITNVDMAKVFGGVVQELIGDAFADAFAGDTPSDAEMEQKMMTLLEKELAKKDLDRVTMKTTLQLKKVDGEWKVDTSDEVMNAVSGGFSDVANELSKMDLN
ncbi:DUF4878 domain-containing protein [Exiguobacterium flavidum]|uniref:DUF4878 domain-containing protein n=1 Tax=Exiguobacterium flavidum TaxID=2184695 RepID=UPI000DF7976B|nr:DUF4878 domain-containing protein [Exiguobacterium flavidum]